MNQLESLNQIFRLHRLFRQNETFSESIDLKRFLRNPRDPISPLLMHLHFGGAITYSIPTTFECIDNPYYLILYVEKGDVLLNSNNGLQLVANDFILLPPHTNFRFDTKSTPCLFHMFLISGTGIVPFANSMRQVSLNNAHIISQLVYLHRLLSQQGNDVPFLISRTLTDILTEAILKQCGSGKSNEDERIPAHIIEMKHIMEHEYQKPLTLDQFERRLLISKYRLCREFSSHFGLSPLQYLNQLRIRESKILLTETEISVHAIACGVGIPNTSHFIKLFKRETHLTPAEYRKAKNS